MMNESLDVAELIGMKFIQNQFVEEYDPTIEEGYRKQVVIDDEVALLDVLDTAGQEEYSAMREQYMRTCEGMLLVYSITSRESFEDIVIFHQQLLRVKDRDEYPVVVLANKSDLASERKVSMLEGMQLAKSMNCGFVEGGAKEGSGITEAFFELVRYIRKYTLAHRNNAPPTLPDTGGSSTPSRSIPRILSMTSLVGLFRSSKSPWELSHDGEVTRQATLNRMLVQAARSNNKRSVKKLIAKGADPNGQPGVEGSALHAAAAVGHVEIVNSLLKDGAAINAKGPRGITALQAAAIEGHATVVRLLLERGAPVDMPSGSHGTALVAAASRGHLKAVRLLIKYRANVNAQGGPYGNALQAAAMLGNAELAKLLLDSGTDINGRGEGDCTALQTASFAGKVEVVKLLLLRGAEINLPGGKYGRALKAAHDRSHFEVVKLLLDFGASEDDLKEVTPETAGIPQEGAPGIDDASPESTPVTTDATRKVDPEIANTVLEPDEPKPSQIPRRASDGAASYHEQTATNGGLATLPSPPPPQTIPQVSFSQASNSGAAPIEGSLIPHREYQIITDIPFEHIRDLGQGSYGFVDEVAPLPDAAPLAGRFARKVIRAPPSSSQPNFQFIQDEVEILKRLRHHHITRVVATYTFQWKFAIIVSPVTEANLKEFLSSASHPPPEGTINRWFGCLTAGLAYIHSQRVRHRDIKPANILVCGEDVLFTDFGIARDLDDDDTTSSIGRVDARTFMYCAPEVAAEERRGYPSDIFSLGCVFLELAAVLMWEYDSSLDHLHQTIMFEGRKAYHASGRHVLHWIITLLAWISTDRPGDIDNAKGYLLEWCFAMLQPKPEDRITARRLSRLINTVDSYVTSRNTSLGPRVNKTPFIGSCCKNSRKGPPSVSSPSTARLLGVWPDHGWVQNVGNSLEWSDISSKLAYKYSHN